MKREIVKFDKAIYFHDYTDTVKLELNRIKASCEEAKIYIKKLKNFDTPQCMFDEQYDILFFDWGGMSMGNSLLESFCKEIYKLAEDNPSRWYIMVSYFTKEAMEEAIREFGNNKPFNIFMSIEDFGYWLDDHCEK